MKELKVNGRRLAMVAADSLRVDARYQRSLDERRAAAIGENYNADEFGFPVVSLRDDGSMWLLDGQHRVTGLVLAGAGKKLIAVEVRSGLTLADEAFQFWKLNEGSVSLRAIDRFRARVVAEDSVAVEIERIAKRAQLKIGVNGARSTGAVVAMEWVHCRNGNLPAVLAVLRDWSDILGGDGNAYDAQIMRYVSTFLTTYQGVDLDRLATRLAKHENPKGFLHKLKVESRAFGGGASMRRDLACARLLVAYNKGHGKKLVPSDRAA